MQNKILLILIILIGLGTGGFFIFKKEVPSEEKETSLGEEIPIPPEKETTTGEEQLPSGEKIQEPQELNLNWQEDAGIRISDGSVPYIYKLKDGRYRLYYCGAGGILSAIAADGLTFQKESGIRIATVSQPGDQESMVCDPTIVELSDSKIRMYYKGSNGPGGPGEALHKVFSAVSSDGLNFQKEGLRIDSENTGDGGWASVPEAIKLSDGRIRIYYVSGDFAAGGGTMSAISNDGLNFQKETGARVKGMVDPGIIVLPDGEYLFLVISLNPSLSPYLPRGIYSYLSKDGLNFENREVVLQKDGVYDPTIIKIDSENYRIYYGEDIGGQPGQPSIVTKSLIGRLE